VKNTKRPASVFRAAWCACALFSLGVGSGSALAAPSNDLITDGLVQSLQRWLNVPVVRLSIAAKNTALDGIDQGTIDDLDAQWRREREQTDQPLITEILSSPLSTYLTRIQAASLGLYSEIFVMDAHGLNVGQSAITSDYWQGDEAKFQKTFDVGTGAVFVDEAELHDETGTWRAQVNMTIADERGNRIGAATVEINLTELDRRMSGGYATE